jgi:hypothetical protein
MTATNPDLAAEVMSLSSELRLRDGTAALKILPAKDVAGTHGKTFAFVGFDEIHAYRDWALIEAFLAHRAATTPIGTATETTNTSVTQGAARSWW